MHPNDGRVVSNFIVQALKGEDITIYGDGMQTRSFCYVDDLIDGLLRLMDHTPDDFTGPVNLGNPVEMPIRELAEKIIKLVNGKSKLIQARPLPVDDPLQRCPDITPGAREAQLGAQGRARRRPGQDDRLFRRPAAQQRDGEPRRPISRHLRQPTGQALPAGATEAYCAATARGRALTTEALPEVISSWIHL